LQCPKCDSRKIGHLDRLPDTVGKETQTVAQYIGVVKEGNKSHRVGRVEAYICTGCGYIELYVMDPRSVPFEEMEDFALMEGTGSDHPYR